MAKQTLIIWNERTTYELDVTDYEKDSIKSISSNAETTIYANSNTKPQTGQNFIILNETTHTQNIKANASATGVSIRANTKAEVYWDGADFASVEDTKIDEAQNDIDSLQADFTKTSPNLFDVNDIRGQGIAKEDGTFSSTTSENYWYSQLIPCVSGEKFLISKHISWFNNIAVFYNSNREVIPLTSAATNASAYMDRTNASYDKFTIPTSLLEGKDLAYVSFNMENFGGVEKEQWMIVRGEVWPDRYMPYGNMLAENLPLSATQISGVETVVKSKISGNKTYIILDFDGNVVVDDNRYQLVKGTYGFPFSFIGVSNNNTNASELNTFINTMIKNGCDMSMYSSYTIPDLATINSANSTDITAWDDYVKAATDNATTQGFYNITAWSARQNVTGSALEKALKKYGYKMVRCTDGIYVKDFDFRLPCVGLYSNNLSTILGYVNTAVQNKYSLCVFTHFVNDSPTTYDCSTTVYTQFLEDLKTKVDSELCEVITMKDYFSIQKPGEAAINDYNRLLKTLT
jgi:hypothetical protein